MAIEAEEHRTRPSTKTNATNLRANVKKSGAILIALAVAFIVAKSLQPKPSAESNVYGLVPPEPIAKARLVNQDHEPVTPDQLKGKVWLVNFFFTSCPGPCPIMTSKISGILKNHPKLHALSITSDPETDTPEVMKSYAAKFGADHKRWQFARGEQDEIKNFAVQVLKLPLGDEPDSHSARIALIDEKGQLRGWFDSQDSAETDRLNREVALSL